MVRKWNCTRLYASFDKVCAVNINKTWQTKQDAQIKERLVLADFYNEDLNLIRTVYTLKDQSLF